MARVIVAAFEPFGGRTVNRSWEAVRALADRPGLEKVVLPVVFDEVARRVPELVARRPDLLVLVGEDGKRRHISVERTARNHAHARIADNAGARPRDQTLLPAAPPSYPATWDAAAMVDALAGAGLRAHLSEDAGGFLCNAAMFHALHAAASTGLAARIGFVHVPVAGFPFGPRRPLLSRALDVCILTALAGRAI